MLQRIYFKFRTSRLHLNFKCFGTSSLRTHFLDTALLTFRDFFEYILITVTRSSKFWYAHSKHCFYHFETWRFVSFQSKRPTYFAKICISIPLRNTYFKHIHKILMWPSNHRNIYCIWLQSRQSWRFSDSLTALNYFTAWCSYKTIIII